MRPDIFLKTPIGYHYANHPAKSVDRIREVVLDNFNTSMWRSVTLVITCYLYSLLLAAGGLPGNDDQAAMASLLAFHILGLYPG